MTLQEFGDDIDEFLREGGVYNAGYEVRRQRALDGQGDGTVPAQQAVFPSEVTLQNEEDDDAKAFDVLPAHLYYKGNSEKRLENKTLDEAEQFFRVRAKRLWDLLKVDPKPASRDSENTCTMSYRNKLFSKNAPSATVLCGSRG